MGTPNTRSFTLSADIAEAVDDAVKVGDYVTADEAIGQALRDWKERRENFGYTIEELRAEVQKGIDSGPAEPGKEFMQNLCKNYEALGKGLVIAK